MKKVSKKLLALACVTIMLLCTGCGGNGGNSANGSGSGNNDGSAVNGPEGALSDIVEQIYAIKDPTIGVGTIEIDLSDADAVKMYTGLDSTDSIQEAVASEAMISAQAYSMVLVRTNSPEDAEAVATDMKAGINPAKWICVEADDLQVVASGDVVLLIMVSSQLSDSVTSQEIVDAFREVCGGTLTVE